MIKKNGVDVDNNWSSGKRPYISHGRSRLISWTITYANKPTFAKAK